MVKAPRSEKEAAAEKRQATEGTGKGRRSLKDRGVCWRNRLRVTVWLLSSAGVCVLDSGNLHAPFPLHVLQVVGWVDCMWTLAASGCSLCFCILSCVLLWTFFTPADLTGCYWQGEFTWSGVCVEELLLFWCLLNSIFPTSVDLLTHSLSHLDLPCSEHFPCEQCFGQPNFKQIWQESLVLCNRGGAEGICPLVQKALGRAAARRIH